MVWETLIFLLISLIATTAGAISGIGGGVIIKPLLDAISDKGASMISFLSGCTVLSMSVVSLLRGRNDPGPKVDTKRGTLLALGAAVGGIGGKYLFDLIKSAFGGDEVVGAAQSGILLLMTFGVMLFVHFKSRITPKNLGGIPICLGIGLLLGLMSAFLGIGGGPINIAVLYYFFAMDSKTAAKNSIYIIFFSQITSLFSTIITGSVPPFDWITLGVMVLGGVAGGFIGRGFSKKMSNRGVDLLFMGIMICIVLLSAKNFIGFFFT